MPNRSFIAWAALFGMTAVILGALGAHALQGPLDADKLDSFETGVRYQMWHAIVLLVIGMLPFELKFAKAIGILWIVGIFLFSGSIFLLSTRILHGFEVSFLGPVTPIGGLSMIAGWLLLLISAFASKPSHRATSVKKNKQ